MSDEISKDSRFSHITKDPRFLRLPKKEQRTKIDKRFHGMFNDDSFKVKYSMDKRGRPIVKSSSDDLKKFYDVAESDDTGSDSDSENDENANDSEKEKSSDKITKTYEDKNCPPQPKLNKTEKKIYRQVVDDGPDLARGEGNITSESDSDDVDDEDEDDIDLDHNWEEIDNNVTKVDEPTHRLAVCSMDWDRVKAADLYFLFDSFKPPTGLIKSIKIYPSDFGLARMKEESSQGPVELKVNEETEEQADGERYDIEKLRAYQMKRLNYYYAIVDCDSASTAAKLYEECDGREFESSCSRLDLRFVPDDITFDHEPTSVCTDLPNPNEYTANNFITKALGQSKVDFTWDETDNSRFRLLTRKFTKDELEDLDFKAYLASSSEEELDEIGTVDKDSFPVGEDHSDTDATQTEEQKIQKYRELINAINENESKKLDKDVSMEVTWDPGVLEKTGELIKKKKKIAETTWDQYVEDRKDKQRKKRDDKEKNKKNVLHEKDGVTKRADFSGDSKDAFDGEVAFSDDDLPTESFVNLSEERQEATSMKKSRKKKKKVLTKEEQEEDDREKKELSLLMDDDDHKGVAHFNLSDLIDAASSKKRKKKRKADSEKVELHDTFKMEVQDARFDAVYSSHHFNVDPSAPEFKKTKGMEEILKEKTKRRHEKQPNEINNPLSDNVNTLIQSVRAKTKLHNKKKKKHKNI